MALTRKMLKAMGIEEEKIEQIIEAHAETVDTLKEQRDTLKADSDKLAEVQKELDKAKKSLRIYFLRLKGSSFAFRFWYRDFKLPFARLTPHI